MGMVEQNYLTTVEGNISRLRELNKIAGEISTAILEGRTDDPEQALRTEFDILMEINGLYADTQTVLDMVTSEENYFRANRFYKELQEFKPLVVEE